MMMVEKTKENIIIATHNEGKLRELEGLCADLPYDFVSQKSLNIPAVEETGLSFVENAILKARAASEATGLTAIADDSGLVVPALAGEPGIYSARYAGPHASDLQTTLQTAHIPYP
jgi:XTP/dITP diphosphohydrolase